MRTLKQPWHFRLAILVLLSSVASTAWAVGSFDLVSRGNDGSPGSGFYNGDHSAITPDGRYVAFASRSTSLVANDSNGVGDIFVKNTVSGETQRVSVNSTGVQGNAASSGRPG